MESRALAHTTAVASQRAGTEAEPKAKGVAVDEAYRGPAIPSFKVQRRAATMFMACLVACGCGQQGASNMNVSVEPLGKYITVPKGTSSARWELVTLPEQRPGAVPGPTDYVSLVAFLSLASGEPGRVVGSLPPMRQAAAVPAQFVRSWLPSEAAAALANLTASSPSAGPYDATSMAHGHPKRALAVAVREGLVLYVEYVAP
jgi:hypothetical protein